MNLLAAPYSKGDALLKVIVEVVRLPIFGVVGERFVVSLDTRCPAK